MADRKIMCPMCGGRQFESGSAAGHYAFKFKRDDCGAFDRFTVFGGDPTYARRCMQCGFLAIFVGIPPYPEAKCLTTPCGKVIEDPTVEDMHAAIEELQAPDREFDECRLGTPDGWILTFDDTHRAVLDCLDAAEDPWHRTGVSAEEVVAMWQLLLDDDLDTLKAQGWQHGA